MDRTKLHQYMKIAFQKMETGLLQKSWYAMVEAICYWEEILVYFPDESGALTGSEQARASLQELFSPDVENPSALTEKAEKMLKEEGQNPLALRMANEIYRLVLLIDWNDPIAMKGIFAVQEKLKTFTPKKNSAAYIKPKETLSHDPSTNTPIIGFPVFEEGSDSEAPTFIPKTEDHLLVSATEDIRSPMVQAILANEPATYVLPLKENSPMDPPQIQVVKEESDLTPLAIKQIPITLPLSGPKTPLPLQELLDDHKTPSAPLPSEVDAAELDEALSLSQPNKAKGLKSSLSLFNPSKNARLKPSLHSAPDTGLSQRHRPTAKFGHKHRLNFRSRKQFFRRYLRQSIGICILMSLGYLTWQNRFDVIQNIGAVFVSVGQRMERFGQPFVAQKIGSAKNKMRLIQAKDAMTDRNGAPDIEAVMKLTQMVLRKDPKNAEALSIRKNLKIYLIYQGKQAIERFNYSEARIYLTDAQKIDPKDPEIQRLLKQLPF